MVQRLGPDPGQRPHTLRYGCTGREYMDLGMGKLHFAYYAKRLKPWDHAAGVLIHLEAGGYSALCSSPLGSSPLVPGGSPYRPAPEVITASLLMAPDKAGWEGLNALIEGV